MAKCDGVNTKMFNTRTERERERVSALLFGQGQICCSRALMAPSSTSSSNGVCACCYNNIIYICIANISIHNIIIVLIVVNPALLYHCCVPWLLYTHITHKRSYSALDIGFIGKCWHILCIRNAYLRIQYNIMTIIICLSWWSCVHGFGAEALRAILYMHKYTIYII